MIARRQFLALGAAILAACILLLALLWLRPLMAYTLLRQGLHARVHSWVKVVDQNDRGVPGYQCRVDQERASWWPFSKAGDVAKIYITSADGTFEFRSKGKAGRVFYGYDVRNQWRLNPDYLMQTHCLGVTPLEYQREVQRAPSNYLGSKDNPYVIRVFAVGPPQKLLYWKRQLKLEAPTDYACVDLLMGRVWESKTPEGDIAIRDNPFTEDNIRGYCLRYFMAGKNCGLYPVVDDWGLEPPETGYRNELCANRDWRALRIQAGGDTAVYYRIQNHSTGQYLYGRLVVGGSGRVGDGLLECYTNLQGERDLYYKGYRDFDNNRAIQEYISPPVQQ